MKTLVARELTAQVGHTEGPVIRPSGEIVYVSMDRGLLYEYCNGTNRVLADVGFYPNGATEGLDGTIYITQVGKKFVIPPNDLPPVLRADRNGTGGIQAIARDGTVEWLTRDPISPNDLCIGPDAKLYVTDPTRGVRTDGRLWRCDLATGDAELLCSVPWYPNGIGFGLDDALYVASSGERRIYRISIDGGRLGKPETFVQLEQGLPDGFTFDVEGNLVTSSATPGEPPAGSVQTFDRNGKLVDTYYPGNNKLITNVALSPERQLVITDSEGERILAVDNWPHAGLLLYPFRKQR